MSKSTMNIIFNNNKNMSMIVILIISISIIISLIPGLTYKLIYLFNLSIVRGLFVVYIGYLTFYNIDYAILITLLFLIMLEVSNRLLLDDYKN